MVRTSVSPDRILRRRRKKRRTKLQPGIEDVIEICSDSEEDADASGPQNSQTSLGSWNSSATLVGNRQVIDLTRSASPPPAPSSRQRQRQSSSRRHRRRPVPPSPTASQSEKASHTFTFCELFTMSYSSTDSIHHGSALHWEGSTLTFRPYALSSAPTVTRIGRSSVSTAIQRLCVYYILQHFVSSLDADMSCLS